MKKAFIDTEPGNEILKSMIKSGWNIVTQYDKNAFDKGIDFDSYTLEKDGEKMVFEWSNWLDWEVTGKDEIIDAFAKKHSLITKNG